MQEFTIKDIENLCGIKAHTLRIWEQRYKFFIPKRKQSLHRIYENEDLKKLLRVAFLYHNGKKISHIAALTTDQIIDEVQKTEINSANYRNYIIRLIEAAVEFNELRFLQILDELTQVLGFEKCITEVCYPYLQRIGLLWVTNNIIPAQEHFSSYLIQNKIIAAIDRLPPSANKPNIVLMAPQGEHHELPLLFIYYLLKKNGWSVVYLGSSITKDILSQLFAKEHIPFVFMHMITNFTGWEADNYFEDICQSFPEKKIVATGSVVQQMQRNFSNLKLLRTDKEIYEFAQTAARP